MNPKTKNLIRKGIYALLFGLMIFAFIYLSEKYERNAEDQVRTMNQYYDIDFDESKYEIITGSKFIELIKKGKNVIIVGSQTSAWSKQFVIEVNNIITDKQIDKVYYYDLNNDKAQKNSNYYKIKELLSGSLTTTDGSNSNLLAPSLYIIDEGEVKYYNVDTVAMKNTIKVDEYWNELKKLEFANEVSEALNKYYLNN